MKVGILSMQRIDNYGSLLQAYALKSLIESLGHTVGFLDIETGDTSHAAEASQALQSEYHNRLNRDNVLYKMKEKIFTNRIFAKFRTEFLDMNGRFSSDASGYDAVVIGSDEVFNYSLGCSWGITPQLFGDIKCPLVLSYAASCGYAKYDDILDEHKDALKKAIMNLGAVSVRDMPTKMLVEALGGKNISINLDPVLMYTFERELGCLNSKKAIPANSLIVYGYTNRFSDPSEIAAIQSYASRHNLVTVCIGGWQAWCDKYYASLDPFGVLSAFRDACAVVTDTFHGAILAAKFNKPMAVVLRESNTQKLGDLIQRVRLESVVLSDFAMLEQKLSPSNTSFEEFNQIIERESKLTMDYLMRNLGMVDDD